MSIADEKELVRKTFSRIKFGNEILFVVVPERPNSMFVFNVSIIPPNDDEEIWSGLLFCCPVVLNSTERPVERPVKSKTSGSDGTPISLRI